MGIFNDIIDGIDSFLSNGTADGNRTERGRIERLCRQLGWSLDGREGDTLILRFNHRTQGACDVRVTGGDSALVMFLASSRAAVWGQQVPEEVLGYLLLQNAKAGTGGWVILAGDDDTVSFHMLYRALGAGLDAPALKFICEGMAGEVFAFDDKMRRAGLLR
jgi:hypothetical protein